LYLSDVGLLTSISEIKCTDIMLERPFDLKGQLLRITLPRSFERRIHLYTIGHMEEMLR